ncbi:extracellular solute-binding protein [Cohnella rhizosphaerae]|uniref:Extracellular solute-binding protein n=1 Tax=Cohnella rhizosphaerae TaxID=1457232 RepID=A0A9X4L4V1_9BACL|nr:extracellular solute-binding protein [Cohnella rhizosphaerae]MDG0813849.1 extracellular solute-binding protein [Cohnella rhizosphaerae]
MTPLYLPNKDGWTAQILVYIGSQYVPIKEASFAEGVYTNKLQLQDSPALVDMFKRVLDFKTKGYMNDDMLSATMAMAEQALAEGKTAFVAGGNWLYTDFQSNYPDQAADISMTGVNWGDDPADFNVMKTGAGASLYIPAQSRQKEAAEDFVNFVLSERVMKAMYEVRPGANVLGYETKANPWDTEMQSLLTSGVAHDNEMFVSAIANFKVGTGFNAGDIGAAAQALFAGKDPVKALADMQSGLAKANKAKGIPGF